MTLGLNIMKLWVDLTVMWSVMPSIFVRSTGTMPSCSPSSTHGARGFIEAFPAIIPSGYVMSPSMCLCSVVSCWLAGPKMPLNKGLSILFSFKKSANSEPVFGGPSMTTFPRFSGLCVAM